MDVCCFDKTGTLTSDDMVTSIQLGTALEHRCFVTVPPQIWEFLTLNWYDCNQEFRGVVGSDGNSNLETEPNKLSVITMQILAACHALVFVDGKTVSPHPFLHVSTICRKQGRVLV